jgi:hypothetical protein
MRALGLGPVGVYLWIAGLWTTRIVVRGRKTSSVEFTACCTNAVLLILAVVVIVLRLLYGWG